MKSFSRSSDEKAVKEGTVISRDRAIQAKKFTSLFSMATEYCSEFPEQEVSARELWEHLLFVAVLMRRDNGASVADLMKKTGLAGEEIRRCIRILIDLGGEVQVIVRDRQNSNDFRFILHN